MSGGPQRNRKGSAYDAFSAVDSLVSKPIMGSDGAASWQEFQSNMNKTTSSQQRISRGVAPHIPLKQNDKLSGMTSIEDERRIEEDIRLKSGDRRMGSGYTVFKRKGDHNAHQGDKRERKRRKDTEERTRPESQKYYIRPTNWNDSTNACTFEGWKEDYIFTTRDGKTGYYWDGMDSYRKLMNGDANADDINADDEAQNARGPAKKDKKKKKKKKKSKESKSKSVGQADTGTEMDLPNGWQAALDPTSNKTYYYNVQLNKTIWEKPTSASTSAAATGTGTESSASKTNSEPNTESKIGGGDQNGWEETKDASTGKTYYFNRLLNKTTWDRPF